MNKSIKIFFLFYLLMASGCKEEPSKGFIISEEQYQKDTENINVQYLDVYPERIDTIVERIIYEYYEKDTSKLFSVYHPIVVPRMSNNNSYIDTTKIVAEVFITDKNNSNSDKFIFYFNNRGELEFYLEPQ